MRVSRHPVHNVFFARFALRIATRNATHFYWRSLASDTKNSIVPPESTKTPAMPSENLIKMLRKDLEEQLKLQKKEKRLQLEAKNKQPLPVRVWNKLRDPKGLARLAWHALVHTWHGFRLFWLEARLSAKYVSKLARGQPLLRKERQQMIRTSLDVARLFPFSLFIIVPFMELLLPFYIKLFPRMMPSTFQDTSDSEQQYKRQLKAKNETAKFLQDSLEEIALARQKQGHAEGAQAIEFAQFLKKIRTGEGGYVNNEELFKFSKLFEDQLTLDNLSMVHLRALCRLLGIAQLGTPEILRFRLRMKLRELKADDQLIEREGGVEVLSAQELQAACRARGMRALGLSEERLRQQLRQWVELSSDEQVPPSLLLLTRAMYFPEDVDFTARIRAIVGSLPKEIGDFKAITLKELEGGSDPQAKIELLRSIEADLKAERKLREERKKQSQERERKQQLEEQHQLEEGGAASGGDAGGSGGAGVDKIPPPPPLPRQLEGGGGNDGIIGGGEGGGVADEMPSTKERNLHR
ncbi:hypothetical protein niasHT_029638 [Heterodera trifolii]|uniref:Letm1 RBD domain-containing protein n=1 Tax=Heterodera trifolii TaxID=157864 RepID=A0ABD2K1U0_9BILA